MIMFKYLLAASMLAAGFVLAMQFEPTREGKLHDSIRGRSIIKSAVLPSLEVVSPVEDWEGRFIVRLNDFDYRPDLATNPVQAFANGFQEINRGHIHGWVFDSDSNLVRFYGAAGTQFDDPFYIKPDEFPPGRYTAYFQLQNHDHTPVIPALAPQFPPIASVSFWVTESESGAGVSNVPNCGCGKTVCETNQ
jgi:hypothetical protein